jgi:hypothetical protein
VPFVVVVVVVVVCNRLAPNIRYMPTHHAVQCSKHQVSSVDGAPLLAFHVRLSFRFWSPSHHTVYLILLPKGECNFFKVSITFHDVEST